MQIWSKARSLQICTIKSTTNFQWRTKNLQMTANTVTDFFTNKARKTINVTETSIKANLPASVLNDKSHAVQTLSHV